MEYKFDVAFQSLLTWSGMSASHLLFIKDKNSLFGELIFSVIQEKTKRAVILQRESWRFVSLSFLFFERKLNVSVGYS